MKIIFDYDGTLIDTKERDYPRFKHVLSIWVRSLVSSDPSSYPESPIDFS